MVFGQQDLLEDKRSGGLECGKLQVGLVCGALVFVGLASALWREPLASFPIWIMGALVSVLPIRVPNLSQRVIVILAAAQFLVIAFVLWMKPFSYLLVDDAVLGLSFSILIYAILHDRVRRSKTRYDRLAELLARPSYSLYLFHTPIVTLAVTTMALYRPSLLHFKSLVILFLGVITYAICYGVYYLFEKNTDWVRQRAMDAYGYLRPVK